MLINGNVKITDGNQTDGYILSTDANGLASWVNPASVSVIGTGSTGLGAYWTSENDLSYMNLLVATSGDVSYIDFDLNDGFEHKEGRLHWIDDDKFRI